jgi:HK97 family phage major capsid protein
MSFQCSPSPHGLDAFGDADITMTTPATTTVVSRLPTGTAFSRYLMVKREQEQHGTLAALDVAKAWRDTPQVLATLQAELQTKAAVAVGTTSDSTWAGPLAQYGIASEALELLRGSSILGALSGKFRRVPFRTKVARETGSGTGGGWIGEGLGTPIAATAYDTLSQEAYKAGKISVLSEELRKLGDPDAERTVRDTVISGMGGFLDGQLLTPTVTLSAGLRPAAITNGATAVVQSGVTAAAMVTDLTALLAAITTTGASLVWVMRPLTAAKISAALGSVAADVPRTLFGIPLVLSANSPLQITLIDAANILYLDTGGFDVSTSTQAVLEMTDTVTDPPVAATVYQSLFQRNLWAVRVIRWLAYLRAQTGAVAYMTVTY